MIDNEVERHVELTPERVISKAIRKVLWKANLINRDGTSEQQNPIEDQCAAAALSAIEEAGISLCQAKSSVKGETVSAAPLQSTCGGDEKVRIAPTNFGDHYHLPMPDDCDVVILCGWNHQIRPYKLLLPHQVYTETVKDVLKSFGTSEAWVIPARSKDYIKLPILEGVIEEAQRADTERAANAESSLTPINQDADNE